MLRYVLAMAVIGLLLSAGSSARAQLLVYEGFQYAEVGDELIGKPDEDGGTDATGLSATWQDAAANNGVVNDMFLKPGNLAFGDLAAEGNHIGFQSNLNNDRYHRPLSADAQAGVSGAGEIWFSFLVEKLQNNFSAGEGGFALANQTLGTPRIFENGGSTALNGLAGFGAGPTTSGNDWTAYAWDGTNKVTGDATIPMPPANGNSNTSDSNLGDVRLIVGQITFDIGVGGTDRYTLYDYQLNDGSVVGGTLNQIASPLEVDVDQSELDTLNLTRQVNLNYDEVRIGTTLESVLAILPAADFAITEIGYAPGGDTVTLTWRSRAGASYIAKWSLDMVDWSADLGDGLGVGDDEVADDGDQITVTFSLTDFGLEAVGDVFFRIEEE